MAIRLGIWETVRTAAHSLWSGGRPLAVCLLLWIAAEFSYSIVQDAIDPALLLLSTGPLSWTLDTRSTGAALTLTSWLLVESSLRGLVDCVFVTAMLRIILIGKARWLDLGPEGLARAAGAVLLAGLVVTVAVNGPLWLLIGIAEESVRTVGGGTGLSWSFVPFLLFIYLTVRLCLVYPSAAIGRGWDLARNWRRMAGNEFRLAGAFMVVCILAYVANAILEAFVLQHLRVAEGFSWLGWFDAGKAGIKLVVIKMLLLALAAVAYTRLTDFPSIGVPGARGTPSQIAKTFE